jgi:predicted transcriptional regulator of viral defense system
MLLYRVKLGELEHIWKGVYRLAEAPERPNDALYRAYVIAGGTNGEVAISHDSAAHLHGLISDPPSVVHLTHLTRGGGGRPRPGIQMHRTHTLHPGDVQLLRGFRVIAPARCVVDLIELRRMREAYAIMQAALTAKMVSTARLRAAAAHKLDWVREVLEILLDGQDADLERLASMRTGVCLDCLGPSRGVRCPKCHRRRSARAGARALATKQTKTMTAGPARGGERWSDVDETLLLHADLSPEEKALRLGRTLYAVLTRLRRLRSQGRLRARPAGQRIRRPRERLREPRRPHPRVPVDWALTLAGVADQQGGYLTTRQADAAGVSPTALMILNRAGDIRRVDWGIYQFPGRGDSALAPIFRAYLPPRGSADLAIISYESALHLHGLIAEMPPEVHLTFPAGMTVRRPAPDAVHHFSSYLDTDALTSIAGLRVTSAARAIVDCIERPSGPQVEEAVHSSRAAAPPSPHALVKAAAHAPLWVRECAFRLGRFGPGTEPWLGPANRRCVDCGRPSPPRKAFCAACQKWRDGQRFRLGVNKPREISPLQWSAADDAVLLRSTEAWPLLAQRLGRQTEDVARRIQVLCAASVATPRPRNDDDASQQSARTVEAAVT